MDGENADNEISRIISSAFKNQEMRRYLTACGFDESEIVIVYSEENPSDSYVTVILERDRDGIDFVDLGDDDDGA